MLVTTRSTVVTRITSLLRVVGGISAADEAFTALLPVMRAHLRESSSDRKRFRVYWKTESISRLTSRIDATV